MCYARSTLPKSDFTLEFFIKVPLEVFIKVIFLMKIEIIEGFESLNFPFIRFFDLKRSLIKSARPPVL